MAKGANMETQAVDVAVYDDDTGEWRAKDGAYTVAGLIAVLRAQPPSAWVVVGTERFGRSAARVRLDRCSITSDNLYILPESRARSGVVPGAEPDFPMHANCQDCGCTLIVDGVPTELVRIGCLMPLAIACKVCEAAVAVG